MTTLLLLGDSHLAWMSEPDVRLLAAACDATEVARVAVAGSTSLDLSGQLDGTGEESPEYAVISVGSNDAAAGDSRVALRGYREALGSALDRLGSAYVVVLGPPPVIEARRDDLTNAELAAYAAAASDAATEHLATYIRTDAVLDTDLDEVLVEDGLHLSARGYDKIVAALADALAG
jgi:lysophospholipase L1-like esterase